MDHSSVEEALSCRHRMRDDRPFGSADDAEFEQVSIGRGPVTTPLVIAESVRTSLAPGKLGSG
jgi:hypothetical protein